MSYHIVTAKSYLEDWTQCLTGMKLENIVIYSWTRFGWIALDL